MAREVKNSFQQRLANAIQPGDFVAIARYESGEGDDLSISVRVKDDKFGMLEGTDSLLVEKATPGELVKIIERIGGELRRGADAVRTAQVRSPQPQTTTD